MAIFLWRISTTMLPWCVSKLCQHNSLILQITFVSWVTTTAVVVYLKLYRHTYSQSLWLAISPTHWKVDNNNTIKSSWFVHGCWGQICLVSRQPKNHENLIYPVARQISLFLLSFLLLRQIGTLQCVIYLFD